MKGGLGATSMRRNCQCRRGSSHTCESESSKQQTNQDMPWISQLVGEDATASCALGPSRTPSHHLIIPREPLLLEASRRGEFAVGGCVTRPDQTRWIGCRRPSHGRFNSCTST